jgi:carboxymethylenebutenolidase
MNLFQRYLAEEFAEDYQEGRLSRRDALKLIASVMGSLILADAFLAACTPPPAALTAAPTSALSPTDTPEAVAASPAPPTAQPTSTEAPATSAPASPTAVVSGTVSPDDPAVEAGPVQFEGEGATLLGYLARPAREGSFPIVLVCHENRGLTAHIQDVTRRLAKAGYTALAVDLLSRQGGTEAVGSGNVPGALGNMPPDQFVQDFVSGRRYLQGRAFAQADRAGMTGFCFGGGVTWLAATQMPELKAAVPFYGPHPPLEAVPDINAAVLAIYGELDQRINQGLPLIEAAMREHDKVFEKIIYPNADHAFHNDAGSRYNPEAARDAWARTLAWFGKYL